MPKTAKLKYRADIDGLRALAVLGVLVYHCLPAILPGGFVGVDVFFVISGFLITGIIVRNARNTGSLKLVDFYSSRVLRIFPSLILVFIFSVLLGNFVLFTGEFKVLCSEVFYGSIFSSNLRFFKESGYFDSSSEMKPFLHLWSLGVEEQFYIFWPLIFKFVIKRFALVAILVSVAASFLLNVVYIANSPMLVFYSPLMRCWEFGIGGSLVFYLSSCNSAICSKKMIYLMSLIGLIMILAPMFLLNSGLQFPGWLALFPTVGAAFVIQAGPTSSINLRLLSSRPLVAIGRLSYPLYLWHWPLLYFTRVFSGGHPEVKLKILSGIISLFLAYLSAHYVEKPFRNTKRYRMLAVTGLLVGATIVGLSAHILSKVGNGHLGQESIMLGAEIDKFSNYNCGLDFKRFHGDIMCRADRRGAGNLAIIGDSHADALYPGLVRNALPGQNWLLFGKGSCAPLINAIRLENVKVTDDARLCRALNAEIIKIITDKSTINTVVLVIAKRILLGEYTYQEVDAKQNLSQREIVLNGLSNLIAVLLRSHKKVVFVVDNPAISSEPSLCLPRTIIIPSAERPDCKITRQTYEQSVKEYRGIIQELNARYSGLVVFDTTDYFCDSYFCSVLKNGKSMFSYTDHMSDVANNEVSKALNKLLLKP